jgi:hypothetical protein
MYYAANCLGKLVSAFVDLQCWNCLTKRSSRTKIWWRTERAHSSQNYGTLEVFEIR